MQIHYVHPVYPYMNSQYIVHPSRDHELSIAKVLRGGDQSWDIIQYHIPAIRSSRFQTRSVISIETLYLPVCTCGYGSEDSTHVMFYVGDVELSDLAFKSMDLEYPLYGKLSTPPISPEEWWTKLITRCLKEAGASDIGNFPLHILV